MFLDFLTQLVNWNHADFIEEIEYNLAKYRRNKIGNISNRRDPNRSVPSLVFAQRYIMIH